MPSSRHVPLRRCVACRSSLPKAELIRFRRDDRGVWQLDPGGKAGGRGAWLCLDCAAGGDTKRLHRFFRGHTPHIVAALAARTGAKPVENHSGGMHG